MLGIGPEIHLTNSELWTSTDNVHIAGRFLYKGELYDPENAASIFQDVDSYIEFGDILSECHGKLSVIVDKNDNGLFIGHSPVGAGAPLYYSKSYNHLVCDNYYYLEKKVNERAWNPISGLELLSRGRLWGENTLHQNIAKVPRDTVIYWNYSHNSFDSERYYEPYDIDRFDCKKEKLYGELTIVLDSIFERTKKLVTDRPILFGLSGGYDSRLIALMLNKHDFQQVFAYTVNTQSEYDQEIARLVADQLGFDWVPIEHTHSNIREMYKSDVWWEIEELSGGHGTRSPKPSSLVTYNSLSQQNQMPDEGVILSGITPADGVHIPSFMIQSKRSNVENIAEYIVRDECTNMPLSDDSIKKLSTRVISWIPAENYVNNNIAVDILTSFYIHKQNFSYPSILANYFGYEDHRPYQDPQFLEFYTKIPDRLKYDRCFVEDYIEVLNEDHLPNIPIGGMKKQSKLGRLKNRTYNQLRRSILDSPVEPLARSVKGTFTNSRGDNYGIDYGFIPKEIFNEIHQEGYHYGYYLAQDALSRSDYGPD